MSGNEASAIGSVRTIASSEATYASSCGGGGYAVSLADLGKAPAKGPAFIPSDLTGANAATKLKSGYWFAIKDPGGVAVLVTADTCNTAAGGSSTEFFASTEPGSPGSTGVRYFATDHSGMIRQHTAAIADITVGIPLQ
jgi:hypothetical protein